MDINSDPLKEFLNIPASNMKKQQDVNPLTCKKAVELLMEGKLGDCVCKCCLNIAFPLYEMDYVVKLTGKKVFYNVTLKDMLESIYPFQISQKLDTPNKICDKCVNRIISSYLFIQQFNQAERAFQNCIEDIFEKLENLDPLEPLKKRGRQKAKPNTNILYSAYENVMDYAEPLMCLVNRGHKESSDDNAKVNPLQCPKCWQEFSNVQLLLNHENAHPKSMWYNCRTCGTSFPKQNLYRKHIKQAHSSTMNISIHDTDASLSCKCDCGHVTGNYSAHLQHVEKHKFKNVMQHVLERKMDKLCTVCLDKSKKKMIDLNTSVSLYGGYPGVTGERSMYNILQTSLPNPKPSYKYQELFIPSISRLLQIKQEKMKNVNTAGSEISLSKSTSEKSADIVDLDKGDKEYSADLVNTNLDRSKNEELAEKPSSPMDDSDNDNTSDDSNLDTSDCENSSDKNNSAKLQSDDEQSLDKGSSSMDINDNENAVDLNQGSTTNIKEICKIYVFSAPTIVCKPTDSKKYKSTSRKMSYNFSIPKMYDMNLKENIKPTNINIGNKCTGIVFNKSQSNCIESWNKEKDFPKVNNIKEAVIEGNLKDKKTHNVVITIEQNKDEHMDDCEETAKKTHKRPISMTDSNQNKIESNAQGDSVKRRRVNFEKSTFNVKDGNWNCDNCFSINDIKRYRCFCCASYRPDKLDCNKEIHFDAADTSSFSFGNKNKIIKLDCKPTIEINDVKSSDKVLPEVTKSTVINNVDKVDTVSKGIPFNFVSSGGILGNIKPIEVKSGVDIKIPLLNEKAVKEAAEVKVDKPVIEIKPTDDKVEKKLFSFTSPSPSVGLSSITTLPTAAVVPKVPNVTETVKAPETKSKAATPNLGLFCFGSGKKDLGTTTTSPAVKAESVFQFGMKKPAIVKKDLDVDMEITPQSAVKFQFGQDTMEIMDQNMANKAAFNIGNVNPLVPKPSWPTNVVAPVVPTFNASSFQFNMGASTTPQAKPNNPNRPRKVARRRC